MRTAARLLLLSLSAAACDDPAVIAPTSPPLTLIPSSPAGEVVATYQATLAASLSCASELPAAARARTYTARLLSNGRIDWSGPTLTPPPGHSPISAGTISETAFSFSIDIEPYPQSDVFRGLWDDMGGDTYLNISGKGTGTVHGAEIRGTLAGMFAFYEPVVPPNPGVLIVGHYCSAEDHRFAFVKQ